MSSRETFHPVAWLAWLVAAALPALSTRNPLYLSLVLLAAAVVYLALGRRSASARNWGVFVRFSALLWLLTIPFTMLAARYGTIVLFRLPAEWPIIGGPYTGEALLYGLTGGLSLVTLLMVFAVFNIAVDQARLLRLTPGFMYQAGVVTAIAVAFVPQMVASWAAIREAQEVRGHRVRGVRDLLPLIMPLLVTALERAMQLAESMEARGFGGQALEGTPAQRLRGQVALLAGLGGVGIGVAGLGFWPEERALLILLLAMATAAVGWSFWDQGRRVRRSRYHRWTWGRGDRVVLAAALATVAGWAACWLFRGDWLLYYPYPPFSPWPAFQPVLGLLILLLAAPALALGPAPAARRDESGTRMHTDKHGETESALVRARPRPVFRADGHAAAGASLPCLPVPAPPHGPGRHAGQGAKPPCGTGDENAHRNRAFRRSVASRGQPAKASSPERPSSVSGRRSSVGIFKAAISARPRSSASYSRVGSSSR